MPFFRPEPAGVFLKEGIYDATILSVTLKPSSNADYHFVIKVMPKGAKYEIDYHQSFKFERDTHGKLSLEDKVVSRLYSKFIAPMGLTGEIGLNEYGKFIHADGNEVKNIVSYLSSKFVDKINPFKAYIYDDEYNGKIYKKILVVYDEDSADAIRAAESIVEWHEMSKKKEIVKAMHVVSSDLPDL